MKYIGIVRKIDDMGRVVLPKEFRRELDLNSGDYFETFMGEVDGEKVIFVKKATGKELK